MNRLIKILVFFSLFFQTQTNCMNDEHKEDPQNELVNICSTILKKFKIASPMTIEIGYFTFAVDVYVDQRKIKIDKRCDRSTLIAGLYEFAPDTTGNNELLRQTTIIKNLLDDQEIGAIASRIMAILCHALHNERSNKIHYKDIFLHVAKFLQSNGIGVELEYAIVENQKFPVITLAYDKHPHSFCTDSTSIGNENLAIFQELADRMQPQQAVPQTAIITASPNTYSTQTTQVAPAQTTNQSASASATISGSASAATTTACAASSSQQCACVSSAAQWAE